MTGVICYLKRSRNLFWLMLLPGVLLSACGHEERRNINKTVTVQSNAYFAAIRDGAGSAWQVLIPANGPYQLNARSFVVDDSAGNYSVLLVCQSRNASTPYKVYLFDTNLSDMKNLTHACRKPVEERVTTVMYGEIKGVAADKGEMAVLSFARDESADCIAGSCGSDTARLRNVEAFAVKTLDGVRDILGFKGVVNGVNNSVSQNAFFIIRDVDFNASVEKKEVSFEDKLAGSGSYLVDNSAISYVASVTPSSINWVPENGFNGTLYGSVQFVSKGNNILPLAETESIAATTLSFLPLPEYAYKNASSDPTIVVPVATSRQYIEPEEGHQFLLEVTDSGATSVTRSAISFFKTMRAAELQTMPFPAAAAGNELQVIARNKTDYALPEYSWSSYSDTAYGPAQVYYTVISGESARQVAANENPLLSTGLEWHVISTRSSAFFRPGSLQALPDMAGVSSWKAGWRFKQSALLNAKAHIFSSDSIAEGVVAYIMDKSYTDGLKFAQVSMNHASITPLP